MCAERVSRAVAEHDGSFAGGKGIEHRFFGDVGKIDQHANAIHFLNHQVAERAQAMPARWAGNGFAGRVGGKSGIGEGIVAVVG